MTDLQRFQITGKVVYSDQSTDLMFPLPCLHALLCKRVAFFTILILHLNILIPPLYSLLLKYTQIRMILKKYFKTVDYDRST